MEEQDLTQRTTTAASDLEEWKQRVHALDGSLHKLRQQGTENTRSNARDQHGMRLLRHLSHHHPAHP
jgi:hypothetical protein